MIYLLVSLLQFQCGIQESGGRVLSYGTAVYTQVGSSLPQVIFFKKYQSDFSPHPFCQTLEASLKTGATLGFKMDSQQQELSQISILREEHFSL